MFFSYLTIFFVFLFLDEGYYQGGKFQFETEVPDAYNMVVSICHLSHSCHFRFSLQVAGLQGKLGIETEKGSSVS